MPVPPSSQKIFAPQIFFGSPIFPQGAFQNSSGKPKLFSFTQKIPLLPSVIPNGKSAHRSARALACEESPRFFHLPGDPSHTNARVTKRAHLRFGMTMPPLFRQRLVAFDEGAEHIAAVALRFAAFADVVADLPQVVGTLVLIPAHRRALHRLQQVFERNVLF